MTRLVAILNISLCLKMSRCHHWVSDRWWYILEYDYAKIMCEHYLWVHHINSSEGLDIKDYTNRNKELHYMRQYLRYFLHTAVQRLKALDWHTVDVVSSDHHHTLLSNFPSHPIMSNRRLKAKYWKIINTKTKCMLLSKTGFRSFRLWRLPQWL